jgi:hypothetical protein
MDNNNIELVFENNNLTQRQKDICIQTYTLIKDQLNNIIENINNTNIDNNIIPNHIINIICIIIKYIENIKINRKALSGEDKKQIALELGRIIISKEIVNEITRETILNIYNLTCESILENIINVSKNINISQSNCKKFFCL